MIQEVNIEKSESIPPHEDDCGEHPPFFIPVQNRVSGTIGDIVTVRAKCVRSCSRFCKTCDVCKRKCGHVINHKINVSNE